MAAGLVTCAADALFADPVGDWRPFTPLAIGATVAAAACYGLLVTMRRPADRAWYKLLPQAILGALVAVALAWAGRRWSLPELLWLVYPLLIAGGFKLILEDFHLDEPIALFVALAAYGGALILAPRLMRKEA
jgi:hypothetical protein